MRRALVALASVVLLGGHYQVGHYDTGTHADSVTSDARSHYDAQFQRTFTAFNAPLSSNGVSSETDLPAGFPAPDFFWGGWDPTDDQLSAITFTENGNPTAVATPLSPDGTFDTTDTGDPATASTMQARRFDGTDDDYTGPTDEYDAGGDMTACAIFRRGDNALTSSVIGKHDGSTGWSIGILSNDRPFAAATCSGGSGSDNQSMNLTNQWVFICGVFDTGAEVEVHINGNIHSGGSSYPSGSCTNSAPFTIGNTGADTGNFVGDIAAIWIWDGTILTNTEIEELAYFVMGAREADNAAISYTDSGGGACLVTELLYEFSPGWVRVGCHGATRPDGPETVGNYWPIASLTNRLPYTVDMTTGWTENGSSVFSTGNTADSIYGDLRDVTQLTDNDAGVAEYGHVTLDMTALSTSNRVTMTVACKAVSTTQDVDVIMTEQTSGVTDAHNFGGFPCVSTRWRVFGFSFVVSDGDNTDLLIQIGGVAEDQDIATVTETSDLYIVPLGVVWGSSGVEAPGQAANIVSLETSGAAAAYGDSVLRYTLSASAVGSTGVIPTKTTISADFTTGGSANVASSLTVANVSDTSSAYTEVHLFATETLKLIDSGGLNETSPSLTIAYAVTTNLAGYFDYNGNEYRTIQDGVVKSTDTTALSSPTGLTTLCVGCDEGGAAQIVEGGSFGNVKMTRTVPR